MKKVYLIISVIILSSFTLSNDYCSGFNNGYIDGYCYKKVGCLEPISPLCPIPRINEKYTYEGGYNRGFILGIQNSR